MASSHSEWKAQPSASPTGPMSPGLHYCSGFIRFPPCPPLQPHPWHTKSAPRLDPSLVLFSLLGIAFSQSSPRLRPLPPLFLSKCHFLGGAFPVFLVHILTPTQPLLAFPNPLPSLLFSVEQLQHFPCLSYVSYVSCRWTVNSVGTRVCLFPDEFPVPGATPPSQETLNTY